MNEQNPFNKERLSNKPEAVNNKIDTLKFELQNLANQCQGIKESVTKALLELNQDNPERQKSNALNSIKSLLIVAQNHYQLGPELFSNINSVVNKLGILNNINLKDEASAEKRELVGSIYSDMKTYQPLLVEFKTPEGYMCKIKIGVSEKNNQPPYPDQQWSPPITDFEAINRFQSLSADELVKVQDQINEQKKAIPQIPNQQISKSTEVATEVKSTTETKEEHKSVDISKLESGAKLEMTIVNGDKLSKATFTVEIIGNVRKLKDVDGNSFAIIDKTTGTPNVTTEGNEIEFTNDTSNFSYKVYELKLPDES